MLSNETLHTSNGCLAQDREDVADTCGPLLGSVTAKDARLIYRAGSKEQTLKLKLFDAKGGEVLQVNARCLPENDFVAKFQLTSLSPDSKYQYAIMASDGDLLVAPDDRRTIQTLPQNQKKPFFGCFRFLRKGNVQTCVAGDCEKRCRSTVPEWRYALHRHLRPCLGVQEASRVSAIA